MKTVLPLALTALVLALQLASSGCFVTQAVAPTAKTSMTHAFPIAEVRFARGQHVIPEVAETPPDQG